MDGVPTSILGQQTGSVAVWVVANPTGGGGKGAKQLKALVKLLSSRFASLRPDSVTATHCTAPEDPEFCRVSSTTGVGHGTTLASAVISEIASVPSHLRRFVVVCGGDGTLSEVVHGMCTEIKSRQWSFSVLPHLIYLAAGTGADFARMGICCREPKEVMTILNAPQGSDLCEARRVDVGCVSFPQVGTSRYFMNEASIGLSYHTVRRAETLKSNCLLSRLGGAAVFLVSGALEILRLKAHHLRIRLLPQASSPVLGEALEDRAGSDPVQTVEEQQSSWERQEWVHLQSTALVFGNGQYFGGGMMVTPHADPCDQKLAVTSWGESVLGFALKFPNIYSGIASRNWKTSRMFSGARVIAECVADSSAEPAFAGVEADGEPVGSLPAVFEISLQITMLTAKPLQMGPRKKE